MQDPMQGRTVDLEGILDLHRARDVDHTRIGG